MKPLTPREKDVLKQLRLGKNNKEIAQAMGIGYHTVNATYFSSIYRKFGIVGPTKSMKRARLVLKLHGLDLDLL